MKRTEFLSQLEHLITHSSNINDPHMDQFGLAQEIADYLEQIQMLPPSIHNPKFQGGWNIHTHPMYINEWEKE